MVKLTLMHHELPDEETARGFREGTAPILSSLDKPCAAMRIGKDIVGRTMIDFNALLQHRIAGA